MCPKYDCIGPKYDYISTKYDWICQQKKMESSLMKLYLSKMLLNLISKLFYHLSISSGQPKDVQGLWKQLRHNMGQAMAQRGQALEPPVTLCNVRPVFLAKYDWID